jgi:hypothetical protein
MGASGRARLFGRALFLAAIPGVLLVASTATAAPQQTDPSPPVPSAGSLQVENTLSPAETIAGSKAITSRLAQTDPSLLGRTDATPVQVMVKLDYDSVATYQGSVDGLAATSPSITGKQLTGQSGPEQAYEGYVAEQENAFLNELAAVAPDATVSQSLRTVYGGVALTVPANEVDEILAIPNVVAVQTDKLNQPLTDASPDFIGANALYPDLDGVSQAGAGVTVGVLDTGAWPEHPSFADQGNLPPRPGAPLPCNFGDNPLTPANDPFACNHKLIGGQAFLVSYLSDPARAAAEPYKTARDSNGHGTHTGSTTAGNAVDSAVVLGVERGPIHGIAPGAWVSVYKVCGIEGCEDSDTAAAVAQAIKDGVNVINFSISGGTDPLHDPTELAFLDAYAAGVFVAASAGNEGPGAGTANHLSPWVTTVAASTQRRAFESTLTLNASSGASATFTGASLTAGAGPAPVVLSSAAPYSRPLCDAPAAPGTFTGKIVACQRGVNARVEKGFNVLQGGAAGMILYNATLADVETDNHWLPAVHLADGRDFVAFMNANPGVTGSFTAGMKVNGQGDVMAAFSSRGPAGEFIKPDITAPGVQILAGHTPTPESVVEGPPGQYFQAIAGTSMSSPHIAGSATLMKALHPSWTPGQIKSALMTTATTDVVKEDLTTPADPFDLGSGRVDLAAAEQTGLTLDETAARMAALGGDPVNAIHLNTPSINAPLLAGKVTTTRVVKNVTTRTVRYDVDSTAPDDTSITVTPRRFTLAPGQTTELVITIQTHLAKGTQAFGEIRLNARTGKLADQHLPVAFMVGDGDVTLTSSCDPTSIKRTTETSTCTVTAQNNSFTTTPVSLTTTLSRELRIVGASGATINNIRSASRAATLAGAQPGVPSIGPGVSPGGFIPLALFGVTPDPVGDEDILNYAVPPFLYNGVKYDAVGVDSNGYLVAGGGSSEDNNCCNLPGGPSPARPNNVLAPFWTDLDGTGAQGIFATVLTDGVDSWIVIEWQVNVFGTTSNRHFQVWLGVADDSAGAGGQDISFTYDPAALPGNPNGQDFQVGAENVLGQGQFLPAGTLPTQDLLVTSTAPTPGGSVSYTLTVRGDRVGQGVVTTEMVTPSVPGVTVKESFIEVTR